MLTVANYIRETLYYMALAVPVYIIIRLLVVKNKKKKRFNTNAYHEIGLFLFAICLVGLFSQTLLPKFDITPAGIQIIFPREEGGINTELFTVVRQTFNVIKLTGSLDYFYINFIGNLVIFMPIGFFVPLLYKDMGVIKSTFTGFLISGGIEFLQLFVNRGTDVDDIMLNTIGAFLGYMVFRWVRKASPNFVKKFKVGDKKPIKVKMDFKDESYNRDKYYR